MTSDLLDQLEENIGASSIGSEVSDELIAILRGDPEARKDWETVRLGEIARNASRPFDFKQHEYVHFVNTGDVQHGKFLHEELISKKGLPGQAKKAIKKGDILFSEIRPANGRYAYVDFDRGQSVVSTKFMVIETTSEKTSPEYLYMILTQNRMLQEFQAIAESRSGTFPQITFDSIQNIEIDLPPLHIQKQIADLLSVFDEKIELLRAQNKTLESIARTIYRGWVSANHFRKNELALETFCDVRDGTHDSPKPSKEGFPLVTSKNIDDGSVNFESCYFISESDYDAINHRSKVDRYDLLIGMIGTVGEVALIDQEPYFAIKNVGLLKTSNRDLGCTLYCALTEPYGKSKIVSATAGTTQKFISLGELRKLSVPIPPPDLQNEIGELFVKIFLNKRSIALCASIRLSLSHGMLSRFLPEATI